MTDLFEERLRHAARSTPVPEPPGDLIGRVVAERAAGRRALLPISDALVPSRPWIGWPLAGVAAAVVLAFALPLGVFYEVRRALNPAGSERGATDDGLFVSNLFAAQTHGGPSAPSLGKVHGELLRPGRYRYRLQYVDTAGAITPDGDGTIDITESGAGDGAVWRVEHVDHLTVDGQPRTEAETLVVERQSLRPIVRVEHVRPFRQFSAINIAQRFAQDSVLGEMTSGGIHRRIARRLPTAYGPYLADVLAPFALAGVPLSRGWMASVSVVGWAVESTDVFYPVMLRVIGEESIAAPGGTFDCWMVAVVAGENRRVEWVRKSDGLALRSFDQAATSLGHRVYELLVP